VPKEEEEEEEIYLKYNGDALPKMGGGGICTEVCGG
jgi:hypothetical protein